MSDLGIAGYAGLGMDEQDLVSRRGKEGVRNLELGKEELGIGNLWV
jgi:hypothetical protein